MQIDVNLPQCILLNGTSSSGKTSLAVALQERLPVLYLNFSIDSVLYALPRSDLEAMMRGAPITRAEYDFGRLVRGFHAAVAGLLRTGNRLIVDHAIVNDTWRADFDAATKDFTCFRVGVLCAIEVARTRERDRGDRAIGTVDREFDHVHRNMHYDANVDTAHIGVEQAAALVMQALRAT